ncbi:MAG: hypothetical protein IT370_07505, partial [Deltaproteobacteria bacterium]|nr:hypothetical protein [Deltaproteobacteria bacterium]
MAASTARPAVATKAASKPAVGSKSGPIPNLGTNDLVESYVPARLPEGMVTGVWGRAIIRPAGGQPRPLVVGDEVRKGDMILTSQNGIGQIKHDGTRLARVPDGESLENVIVAVNAGDAPPGAGGASGGGLQPGLRVDRLYEVVSAQDYAFDATQAGTGLAVRADVDNGVPTVATVEPGAPGAGDDAVPEGTAAANTLVYTVTLTRATSTALTLPISIGGGTASADDYSGTATFSNGVTRNADGTLNVPAGVSNFTISIPTAPDATVEVDETVPVVVGGVLGTGIITNDDTAPVAADDAGAVTEDSSLSATVTSGVVANDNDVDGDTLTVTSVRTGAETGSGTAGTLGAALVGTYGSLTLNADGS